MRNVGFPDLFRTSIPTSALATFLADEPRTQLEIAQHFGVHRASASHRLKALGNYVHVVGKAGRHALYGWREGVTP